MNLISLEWLLALVYLVGGLNDLFLDLVFYLPPLQRALAQGRTPAHCEEAELHTAPEQLIAILIPAWDEATVIGAMLTSTVERLDYANYDLFVGTYPNDEPTQLEVARVAFDRPRIHRIVCPHPGPTSKADCLNWIVEAIRHKETESGKRYAIFTLQDAEDVLHPLTLKVFNRFVPEYDLVQLPVIPYERPLHHLTGNTYLDEFAEVHLKGLHARLVVGGMVPSAGVGTAFSRAACDELSEQTSHLLFPPLSLTEDYDFSFRLFRNGRRSNLAEVWVDTPSASNGRQKELVAIREFFPDTFRQAVRQKQRWLLGITFQGTQHLGWGRGWRECYMLLRDRLGVVTSFFNLISALLLVGLAARIIEGQVWSSLFPLHGQDTLALVIEANLLLLVNRVVQRARFVARVARRRQVLVTPLRMLWGNVIDFYCAVHAIRRFAASQLTGKPLKWLKTAHEYPNVETLLRRPRPLGDILLEHRAITADQLTHALRVQSRSPAKARYLGEILCEIASLAPAQLREALTLQASLRLQVAIQSEAALETLSPLGVHPAAAPAYPSQVRTAPFARFGIASDPVARAPRGIVRVSIRAQIETHLVATVRPAPTVRRTVSVPPPTLTPNPHPERQSRRFTMLQRVAQNLPAPTVNKRFLVVIGTRPEAIKLAPLIAELRVRALVEGRPDDVFVCLTGQHQDMVREPLALFGITPDLDLALMHHGQSLAALSSRVLDTFTRVLNDLEPDWVVVQGDTTTTSMAALAAFYAGIKIAHIEAGLRTNDLNNPFPEEANRRIVSLVATMHFAATDTARRNLLREGIPDHTIRVTGNTGIDALKLHCRRIGLALDAPPASGPIRVLVTAHRRENLVTGIDDLCLALRSLVEAQPRRFHFIWPLHPNPLVAERARHALDQLDDITLSPAIPYERLLALLAECDLVLTDSGGLQEEAPSFGKPVLILRQTTERPEGVYAGIARLVGTRPPEIRGALEELAVEIDLARRTPQTALAHGAAARPPLNPYGDGRASTRIADFFADRAVSEFGYPTPITQKPKPHLKQALPRRPPTPPLADGPFSRMSRLSRSSPQEALTPVPVQPLQSRDIASATRMPLAP